MPKTPESGGIPLPPTWPVFTRSIWDARATSLLESLGRMGHEKEGYATQPPVLYLSMDDTPPLKTTRDSADRESEDDNADESDMVVPSRLLRTYSQRRRFIVKSMDLHRHTIGGGRSGRRGRAECVAFLRHTLDILDEQQKKAESELIIDTETGMPKGADNWMKDDKGRFLSEFVQDEESTSPSDEDSVDQNSEDDEEQQRQEKSPAEVAPKPTMKTSIAIPKCHSVSTTAEINERPIIIKNDADFFDQHNDLCEVCNLPGELLCCATCNLVFHTKCARPKLVKEPPDDWRCAYCVAARVVESKKDRREKKKAAQACKDMERMRTEFMEQNKEILMGDMRSPSFKKEDGDADQKDDNESSIISSSKESDENRPYESPIKMEEDHIEGESAGIVTKSIEVEVISRKDAALKVSPSSRELENLASVPKHFLVDEQEMLYSNTGRIQRARKKPSIFDSKAGHDSGRKSEDGATLMRKGDGEEEMKIDTPNKSVEVQITTPTPELTAVKMESTKLSKKKKTKNKKLKVPKSKIKILPDTEGVGVLNRLPGTLFDCSVCLDITKIKLCCYCACRVCLNKFGKEQTILCDKCDQEYHTFCLSPPLKKVPEAEEDWICPACLDDEKKKKTAEARKVAAALKKAEEEIKKAEFEEKRRVQMEKRKEAAEANKLAEDIARKNNVEEKVKLEPIDSKETKTLQSIEKILASPLRSSQRTKSPSHSSSTSVAPTEASSLKKDVIPAMNVDQPPKKRGRGRPRKDGRDPIPRQVQTVEDTPTPVEIEDINIERSRSGRKINRTVFHDEMDGKGNRIHDAKRVRKEGSNASETAGCTKKYISLGEHHSTEQPELNIAASFSSSGFVERSAAAAAKSAIASTAPAKSGPRRKPGARECMQMSKKFGANIIDQKYFDVLMDYSKRGKVDHLIRMRERLDDHSRFLVSQLAGLEALVKEKGELDIEVPQGSSRDEP